MNRSHNAIGSVPCVSSVDQSQENCPSTKGQSTVATDTHDQDQSLLVDMHTLCEMLGVSKRTVWRMQSAGELPKPVRLRGAVRWQRCQIEQWVADGCPKTGLRIKDAAAL